MDHGELFALCDRAHRDLHGYGANWLRSMDQPVLVLWFRRYHEWDDAALRWRPVHGQPFS